ncbi:divergent PAP2 family protein [Patescibacteria group bacterium]
MSYTIVLVPFIALILAQIIKVILDAFKGKFSWRDFNHYGGMPSSHSAMVAALATETGTLFGFNTAVFAISLAFAFLIIRDAVGLRMQLGHHSKILNMLIKDLPDYKEDKYPFLEERLGHTYLQAFIGIILGIVLALLIN